MYKAPARIFRYCSVIFQKMDTEVLRRRLLVHVRPSDSLELNERYQLGHRALSWINHVASSSPGQVGIIRIATVMILVPSKAILVRARSRGSATITSTEFLEFSLLVSNRGQCKVEAAVSASIRTQNRDLVSIVTLKYGIIPEKKKKKWGGG